MALIKKIAEASGDCGSASAMTSLKKTMTLKKVAKTKKTEWRLEPKFFPRDI